MHFVTQFFLAHVKFKSKISYLGKGISRIHRQMTEQWSFEVTVKNVMADRWTQMELLFYLFRIDQSLQNL